MNANLKRFTKFINQLFLFLYWFLAIDGLLLLIISHQQLSIESFMFLSYTMFKSAFIVLIVWFLISGIFPDSRKQ